MDNLINTVENAMRPATLINASEMLPQTLTIAKPKEKRQKPSTKGRTASAKRVKK
jgi:hypothetical protein